MHVCYTENTNTGSAFPPPFHQIRLAWHEQPPLSRLPSFTAGRCRGEGTPEHHPDLTVGNKLCFSPSRIVQVFIGCTVTCLLESRCDGYTGEGPQISGMEFLACLTNNSLLPHTLHPKYFWHSTPRHGALCYRAASLGSQRSEAG